MFLLAAVRPADAAPQKAAQLFELGSAQPVTAAAVKAMNKSKSLNSHVSAVPSPPRSRQIGGQAPLRPLKDTCGPGSVASAGSKGKLKPKSPTECTANAEMTLMAAPVSSGQPPPLVDGCSGADDVLCVRSNVTHMSAFRFMIFDDTQPLTITTSALLPLNLPTISPVCYGTAWHGSDGSCDLGSDCPTGLCDVATHRCGCTVAT